MYNQSIENQLKQEENNEHQIDGGQINETPGILFDYENTYTLAHCISADFAFNTETEKFFQSRYGTKDELKRFFLQNNWQGKGYCLLTNNNHIINLVTKNKYYEKASLATIKAALKHMKEICEQEQIWKIAMPRIGYESDGIRWQDVKDIIMDIFMATDFDIRIVYLNEYLKGSILDPDTEKINFGKDRKHIDGNLEHKYY